MGTLTITTRAQEIPNDPNHLPQKIGPSDDSRSGGYTVTGRVKIDGLPANRIKPTIFVIVYQSGRFNQRKQVAENGTYVLNNVPRTGSQLVVEIEKNEVAQYNIIPSPSSVLSQDSYISWNQIKSNLEITGTISAKDFYSRSVDNQTIFDKAVAAIKSKKSETAISLFKQIVKNDPKDFVVWTQLGNLYFLSEKLEDAENCYEKALKQNPEFLIAELNLGRTQLARSETEKAIQTLSKLVNTQPKSADAQHYLGEAYLQAKKGSTAVGYLNEAIRLAPIEKAEIHLRLATLYNGAGLKDRAAAEYKTFLEKIPKYQDRENLEKYIQENLPK